ncbi:MAG: hypothetical protein WD512_15585 [Candidatus Paceibacterota bacterium]
MSTVLLLLTKIRQYHIMMNNINKVIDKVKMAHLFDLEEIKKIAKKLDEKMDITSFSRLPNIYLNLQKFDLLNVPVDQTKIGQKITIDDIARTDENSSYYFSDMHSLCNWINAILSIYPMNINGEITFLMKDDMIDKTFMLKVSNIRDLAKLIDLYPRYTTGSDVGVYNGSAKYKIYSMDYFQILYNKFSFLQNEVNSIAFQYANQMIVMSHIYDHKNKMFDLNVGLFGQYVCAIDETNQTRLMSPFPSYYTRNKSGQVIVKNALNYAKWQREYNRSNLSILDNKPKNLLQIWNTRYLEKIDF